MTVKEQIRADLTEKFADEARFVNNALRLGANKCKVIVNPGDIIQTSWG